MFTDNNAGGDDHSPSLESEASPVSISSKTPQESATPASPTITGRNESSLIRSTSPLLRKIDRYIHSDGKTATGDHLDSKTPREGHLQHGKERNRANESSEAIGGGIQAKLEVKQVHCDVNGEEQMKKVRVMKLSQSRVVPVEEKESTGSSITGIGIDSVEETSSDLSLIKKQLAHIEKQQSSLLDLLQVLLRKHLICHLDE